MKNILSFIKGNCYAKEDAEGNISFWRFVDGKEEAVSLEEIEAAQKSSEFLNAAKEKALRELNSLADYYHNQISGASPQKLARYEAKAKAAAAYASAGSATAETAALLQPEATERGLTLEAHVEAILKANAAFTSAAGFIEAAQAKGKLAIEKCANIEELEAIKAKIPQEAQKAFEAWQASLNGEVTDE